MRAAPSGKTTQYAPDVYLLTTSRVTGRSSTFKWDPYYNQDSQGAIIFEAWNTDTISQVTGSDAPWPTETAGGSGWSCTLNCYVSSNSTILTSDTRRGLETYVTSLLAQPATSISYASISDAIITGIQIVLGPEEPETTAYTRSLSISSGLYSWVWTFGP